MRGGGFQDRGEMRGGGQWTVIKAVGRRGWVGRGTYCAQRWKDGLAEVDTVHYDGRMGCLVGARTFQYIALHWDSD